MAKWRNSKTSFHHEETKSTKQGRKRQDVQQTILRTLRFFVVKDLCLNVGIHQAALHYPIERALTFARQRPFYTT
jgi:hypothetical protein